MTDKEKLDLLNEYLDVIDLPVFGIPKQDSIDFQEEDSMSNSTDIDRSSAAGSFDSDDSMMDRGSSSSSPGGLLSLQRSKATRQLQSVAKQFGSIGRTMSKKIKKNFGSFTRRASFRGTPESKSVDSLKNKKLKDPVLSIRLSASGIVGTLDNIIAAVIRTDNRHEYQEEMIRNYLNSARYRFLKEKEKRRQEGAAEAKTDNHACSSQCITPGCNHYGTQKTHYMCSNCYSEQKLHSSDEVKYKNSPPRHSKSNNSSESSDFERGSTSDKVALNSKSSSKTDHSSSKSVRCKDPSSSSQSTISPGSSAKSAAKTKLHLSTI